MSALPMQHHGVAAGAEQEDPRVLEEPAEDRADLDVLGQPGHAGPQRADAAHPDVDLHPGLRGAVERVDELLVDDRVDLQGDVPGPGWRCSCSISASIRSIRPERTDRGATSSRLNRLRGAKPDSWLNRRVRSSPTCGSTVSRPRSS